MKKAQNIPVSVIVPVFKHKPYLEPAIRSILALDYNPLEIVISDDASPDDTFDVLRRVVDLYKGPHRIILQRNKTNLSMGNFNELMGRATADYIIVAHDDDIQHSNRVRRIMAAYAQHQVSMVTCNATNIDAQGRELRLMVPERGDRPVALAEIARRGRPPSSVQGAALSWQREIFNRFGPIDVDGTARTSDYILPFRAALLKGVYFLDEPLLDRRVHADSRGRIGRSGIDKDVDRVEIASERITQISYMLETLDSFKKQEPWREDEMAEMRLNLVLRLEELARELGTHRNRLHMRKLRMSWISHDLGPLTDQERAQVQRIRHSLSRRLSNLVKSTRRHLSLRLSKKSRRE